MKMRKLKKYKPTKFRAKDSTYDKEAADLGIKVSKERERAFHILKKKNAPRNGEHYLSLVYPDDNSTMTHHSIAIQSATARSYALTIHVRTRPRLYRTLTCKTLPIPNIAVSARHNNQRHGA